MSSGRNEKNTMSSNLVDSKESSVKNETYQELQRIESSRRSLLRKVELPAWRVMFNWKGTILPIIVTDVQLFVNITLFITLRIYARTNEKLPDVLTGITAGVGDNLKTIGGFLSFFLVFFVVQNNNRFNDMYMYCMKGKGEILSIASIARANLPREPSLRLVRHLNAAYAAGFVGLSEAYSYAGYFKEINKNLCLLTNSEMDRVAKCGMDRGGSCYREILQWVQIQLTECQKKNMMDSQTSKLLRGKVLNLQSSISALYNYHDQPVIFFYIHFVVFVSVLYLPLFAVQAAANIKVSEHWAADAVAACLVFLQTVFVIGLRELGQKLSDPFGVDYEDLSVMHYVSFTWRESGRILNARFPTNEKSSKSLYMPSENDIVRNRDPIGEAWDLSPYTVTVDEESFYSDCAKDDIIL